MNHLFKRTLSLIVAAVMVLSMIPANPVHVHAEEVEAVDTVIKSVTTSNGLSVLTSQTYNKTFKALPVANKELFAVGLADKDAFYVEYDGKITVEVEYLLESASTSSITIKENFTFAYGASGTSVKTATPKYYKAGNMATSKIAVYELEGAALVGSYTYNKVTTNNIAVAILNQTGAYVGICSVKITKGQCAHSWKSTDCATVAKTCAKCGVTEIALSGHALVEHAAQDSTCAAVGWDAYSKCSACGKYFDADGNETSADALTVAKKDHTYKWVQGQTTHYQKCSECGNATAAEDHTIVWNKDAERHQKKCTVCGATATAEAHNLEWVKGETQHYKKCTDCGYTTAAEDHTIAWNKDAQQHQKKCTVCGATGETVAHNFAWVRTENEHYQKCSDCNYTTAAEDHTIAWNKDAQQHQKKCTVCGATGETVAHNFEWVKGTDQHHQKCSDCSYITESENHTLVWDKDAEYHRKKCTVCSAVAEKEEHNIVWKTTTTQHREECEDCGYVKSEAADHVVKYAADDATGHWQYCEVCGEKTDKVPHQSADWVADEDADTHSRTCPTCQEFTETVPHVWVAGETVEPSLGEQGYTVYNCVCGATKNDDFVDAISVIEIRTWDDLKALDALVESGNQLEGVTVLLMNDIDLYAVDENGERVTFSPIGTNGKYFKGTFDGQNFTIKNMYQSGWDLGYDWDNYGTIGLFAYVWNATVKNLTIENAECFVEGGCVGAIAGSAWNKCTFENINVVNSTIATYNNRAGGIVGYTGGNGPMTFKGINVDGDTVIAGLWGSFDSSLGGVIGSIQDPTKIVFEDVNVACRLDAYNDVTAAYKYHAYRMTGMLIGNLPVDGDDQPILTNVTIGENVVIDYSNTPDYTYAVVNGDWVRVEAGYAYDGVDLTETPATEVIYKPLNSMFGGQQYGSYGQDDHEDIVAEGRVAAFDGDYFTSFETAFKAADGAKDSEGNPIPVKLMANYDQDIVISESLILDESDFAFTGNVIAANAGYDVVKDENGNYQVVEKTLAGSGTEAAPYLINSVEDLLLFRDKVNAGDTKYNAPGVYVALNADIDLAGATWERGIGDGINATFDGIFDGKNFTIKNLNMAPQADENNYFCGGLFGYTYGAAVIKNLVLENITVTAEGEGHNVGILVGFANNKGGKLTVSNVTIKNSKINASGTYGVGAILGYSYRDMGTIENCTVEGTTIIGHRFVGGIAGYNTTGTKITGCTVKNSTITGKIGVGGIAGLVSSGNVIEGNTVTGTTVSADKTWGNVVGEIGGNTFTLGANNAAEPLVGGAWGTEEAVQAKIGDTYYATLNAAIAAAQEGATITLVNDLVVTETVVIPAGKTITLDLNGKTVSGVDTASQFAMIQVLNGATLTIEGEGTITYAAGGDNTGAAIWVEGALIQNGGTIELTGSWSIGFAVDVRPNAWGTAYTEATSFVMNGGIIKGTDSGVRVASNSSDSHAEMGVSFTMNGGTIDCDWDAVFVQHLYNGDLDVEVKAGTISGENSALRIYGNAGSDVDMTVKGGTITGEVKIAEAYATDAIVISGGSFTADVSDFVAAGYKQENGAVVIDPAYGKVAMVGDAYYETVIEALQAAIDSGASEVKILGNVREKMTVDFDLVINSDLTITADAPVKVEFYNEGTSMDFAVGSTNNNTLTIAENVHFDLTDRVIWLGYYGNNVDVIVEGYLGGYQIWHGADTTVTGTLESHGEAMIMRRNATLTVDGGEVKANYIHGYSGHIVAKDATITAGLVWLQNDHSYGSEGTVSIALDNSTFISRGVFQVKAGADKSATVTLTNGSAIIAQGALETANNVTIAADATSSFTANNASVFAVEANGMQYTTLEAAVAAAQEATTITVLKDIVLTSTVKVPAGKDITIDLNGKTIDGTGNVRIALMTYGDVTIMDSSAEGNGVIKAGIGTAGNAVNVCGGTFTLESGNIYSLNNAILIDEQACTVTINGGTITAEPNTRNSAVFYVSSTTATELNINGGEMTGYNGVLLWNNTTVNMVNGTITATGSTGIQGNGSKDNTEINISGGEISGYWAAIYHPQGGELNISGGELTGYTGVVVKGGNVNISGGTITATGEAQNYQPVSSGYIDTGDALYVEHYDNSTNSENYGTPVVTVTGGTFISAHGQAVASYANPNNNVEALDSFISGGTFSSDVSGLCIDEYVTEMNDEGVYELVHAVFEVYDWDDLKELDARVESGDMMEGWTVKLMNDIDLFEMGDDGEPVTFNPIGANQAYFRGTFDGQGFTIRNMYQSGWALGYDWDNYGTIGLFAYLWDATIKNVTIENAECLVEGGNVGAIAGCAWGTCTFENITVKNSTFATYNNRAAGIVGYTGGEGTMTFKGITIDGDTVIAGLWGSFDSTLGGVVGSIQDPTKIVFEDVTVACRLDAYNDVTAAYKYYAYRMTGMLIGRLPVDGNNQPILTNVTIGDDVVIDYSNTPDYTYTNASGSWQRVEAGYSYGGVDMTQYPDAEVLYKPLNSMFGGQQYGSYGQDDHEDIVAEGREAYFDGDYFTSLENAVKAADGADEPVKLMADYTGDIVISESLKLDLNGFTFNANVTTDEEGYQVVQDANGNYVLALLPLNGEGTEADPYVIEDLADLIQFSKLVNAGNDFAGKFVKLTSDIDMTGVVWTPIGSSNYDKAPADAKKFAGSFDGDNHTITGLSSVGYVPAAEDTESTEYSFGLFGYVYGADIKNVKFANVNIECGTRTNTAGNEVYGSGNAALVGYYVPVDGKVSVIDNCHVLSGSIYSSNNMGGLIGHFDSQAMQPAVDVTISNCSNAASVTAEAREAGGILGLINGTREGNYYVVMKGSIKFINCVNTGAITTLAGGGSTCAGGILGRDNAAMTGQRLKIVFENCSNSGTITAYASGETHVAGLGTSFYSHGAWVVVKNSENTGDIVVINSNSETYAGGLVAYAGVVDLINSTTTGDYGYVGDVNHILFLEKIEGYNDTITGATYHLNGGTSPEYADLVDDAAMGGNFHLVETAYKDNFEFAGWYTNPELTGSACTALVSGQKHYYAKWNVILQGSGTEEDPYLINSVEELIGFRDSVNAGETKYNAPGVYVALTADIDMAGATWERGIGDGINATFDGIFDGNNKTIKNLNLAPEADSDKYFCGGLFGYTYGAAVIKNVVLENITVTAEGEGHNVGALVGFANNNGGKLTVSNVTVKNVTITAPNAYGVGAIVGYSYRSMGTIENCTVDGATIIGHRYVGGITGYSYNDAVITGCTVKNAAISGQIGVGGIAGLANPNAVIEGNTVADTTVTASKNWGYVVGEIGSNSFTLGQNNAAEPQLGGIWKTEQAVQAKIGNTYYATFADAYAAAEAGDTIDLLADIEASEVILIDKSLTINGNGHKVTSSATRVFRVTAANVEVTLNNVNMVSTAVRVGTNDIRGLSVDNTAHNAKVTLNNCSVDFTDASANDWTYAVNQTGANNVVLTINGGSYEGANVINVLGTSNTVVVKDATLTSLYPNNDLYYGACIYVKQDQNSSINATGNTFNGANAVAFNAGYTPVTESNNTDNTTMVVAKVGTEYYTSLADAFAAAQDGDTVKVLQNTKLTEGVKVPAGKAITLDLNGKTITGTDNATGSFALITNQGALTVTGNGKITLKATNDRDWNAYSSIFSNTVGGKLTIENGTFEHLGGTDMAYAIDNLTNGKGTYAETVINGGTIKSTYRAIRQFLNGVEAQNILTVNGGTIEGANKSIWMQDPSANANTGKLTVGENAVLNGDVYLYVCEGSTEWPVEISIAASAVNGEVLSANVPATLVVENVNGTWGVNKGLKGSGTETDPYQISCAAELIFFRDSVNAGETKYNASGVYVALSADIDMAGATWEKGIAVDYTFDGIFDGKNHTISNLNLAPVADSDGWFCGGLFGYTYGAAVIKNVVLDNITVTAEGEGKNVGALVGFAYNVGGKLNVSNVTVKNSTIYAPGTYGVGAIVGYSYSTMGTIENCTVENTTITGHRFVGGISGYSTENAVVTGCIVKNSTITGKIGVGGIVGLAATSNVIEGNTVSDTTVTAPNNWGYVVGELGGNTFVLGQNDAAEPQVGGIWETGKSVQAKIGNKYYATYDAAVAAAKAGDTISLLVDYNATILYVLDGITLDLNGFTCTAPYVVVFNGGHIVDNSESNDGRLVAGNLMINEKNAQLPVKTENGYMFVKVDAFVEKWGSKNYYIAQFKIEHTAHELLKSDMEAAGVSIYIRVTWKNANGQTRSQDFEYDNAKIAQYLASYKPATGKYGSQIFLNLSGTNANTAYTYQVVIESDTGVVFTSDGYTK